ncbi:MAG: polyamine aminopropyltransferase [Peptococcaceae bacterium]|nr:polyamine aminopropyltransferase [Peptococcaceae bacterium]
MNVWFTEYQNNDLIIGCRMSQVLHHEKTPFQDVMVVDTFLLGKMLLLDDVIQTSVGDEFVYHEMITHVGLNTLPNPRRVLVVGGGDGGAVREVLRNKSVEKVTHCEIDRGVIEAAQKFLPEITYDINDPRVELIIGDGIKHVMENKNTYDMIIIDSTDPIGPAVGLFSAEFYQSVHDALTEDGLFVAQTESPFFDRDFIKRIYKDVDSIFPMARIYLGNVPTYPGGLWTFTMGTKKHDPIKVDASKITALDTKFYSPEVHGAAFVLPPFVKALMK